MYDVAQALSSPFARASGMIQTVPHPEKSDLAVLTSPIKVDGERAYDLARAGEAVELQPREIDVDAIKLVEHGTEQSTLEVTCGKGTYVRALARDIAEALGTRGHVSLLHRAAVGPFHGMIRPTTPIGSRTW